MPQEIGDYQHEGPVGTGMRREVCLSRRDALQIGLVYVAGSQAVSVTGVCSAMENTAKRVIVIGAGFAGLATAFELHELGFEVRVFEARDRVGGRVLSRCDLAPSRNIEAGGELIGSNHPTWLAYAAKFGLKFLDVSDCGAGERTPVVLGGRLLSVSEIAAVDAEVEIVQETLTELARAVDASTPWMSPNAKRLDCLSMGDWIDQQAVSTLTKQILHARFTGDNAVPSHRQSLLCNLALIKGGGLEKSWTDTEVYRCEGGNQQLANRLVEAIGAERVTLNCAIRSLTQCEGSVIVEDDCHRRHEADDVVLAVPPSVWKKICFKPTLPSELQVQMGSAVKYLAEVDSRYWKANGLCADATTDGDISCVWEGTDNQPGGDQGSAVLVAFTGGPAAEAIHSRQEGERRRQYHSDLQILFPGFEEHYRKDLFVDWLAEQWTKAGYSFPAPGEVTSVGPLLREGFGRLHFAGEHACYQFVGYMEGALTSGVEAAKRIATRYGLPKVNTPHR